VFFFGGEFCDVAKASRIHREDFSQIWLQFKYERKNVKHYSVFSATWFNPCTEIWRFKNLIPANENLRKYLVLVLAVKKKKKLSGYIEPAKTKKEKKKGCLKDPKRTWFTIATTKRRKM
jgi:hypothetical protein